MGKSEQLLTLSIVILYFFRTTESTVCGGPWDFSYSLSPKMNFFFWDLEFWARLGLDSSLSIIGFSLNRSIRHIMSINVNIVGIITLKALSHVPHAGSLHVIIQLFSCKEVALEGQMFSVSDPETFIFQLSTSLLTVCTKLAHSLHTVCTEFAHICI